MSKSYRTLEDVATGIVHAIIRDLINQRPLLAEAWSRMSEEHRQLVCQKWIDIASRGGNDDRLRR